MPPDRLAAGPVALPPRWPRLYRLFKWYARRYVRRHFHAVRVSKSGHPFPPPGDDPLLVVLNHPAWWDPMICLVLAQLTADRDEYAAIDAEAVKRYAFFTKLGFLPVDTRTLRGAAEFVRTGAAVLSAPRRAYWVTAQGRFTDVRERPLGIASGVGHLMARAPAAVAVPLALEYAFWTERTPEALVRVGEPVRAADHPGLSGRGWTELIEGAMTRNLDALSAEAVTRDPGRFAELLSGRAGVGGVYDGWRRVKAWARGKRFDPSHATGGDRP
jgi:1-acyl-sn-glycerol-3-phosphate acyltransferase